MPLPGRVVDLSLIHISEPTRRTPISYAVFCLKKIFLMIRRPPRSTLSSSSAASDVYKRQGQIDIHQADAHHPRLRLLGRRQAVIHQTSLSEYLHGHELDDKGHGGTQNTVQNRNQRSTFFLSSVHRVRLVKSGSLID